MILKIQTQLSVPKYVHYLYLECLCDYLCDELIDSISKIKKCNDIGRECLITDINHLSSIIEGQLQKHLTSFDQVVEYLRSYFMPREDLLSFIKQNVLVYSYNQIKNLLQIVPSVTTDIKNSDKKEFMMNVDIFYRDYFNNFMLTSTSHEF